MSKEELTFKACDRMVREFEAVMAKPVREPSAVYYTGVDLGTACVVLAVLDEHLRPVAGTFRYADVVRDGMVVDYIGAIRIVREMKEESWRKSWGPDCFMQRPPFRRARTPWTPGPLKMWCREPDLKSRPCPMSLLRPMRF